MSNFNRAVLGEVLKDGINQLQLDLNEKTGRAVAGLPGALKQVEWCV